MRIKPLKYSQNSALTAAVGTATLLDATLVSGGVAIASVGCFVIQAESQSLRWRDDGTAPTAAIGNVIPAGQSLVVYRPQFGNFKVIETTPSAKANITAYTGDGPLHIPPGFGGGSVTGTVTSTPAATESHLGQVGGEAATPAAAQFTRPADATAYASGDIVANNVTAGSVVALSWTAARVAAGSFFVRRGRIKKSTASVTNAAFRIHLFSAAPTVSTAGDNAVFTNVNGAANYLGYLDVTAMVGFNDGAAGHGAPGAGSECTVKLASGQTIYGLLEARGAYTPGNAETFDVSLELVQN